MRVIARRTLRVFWEANRDAEQPLKAWFREAEGAQWDLPHAIKAQYRSASILGGQRVVFKIAGNKHRLVVRFNFALGIAFIRFIGTHAEYDRIDAEET